MIRRYEEIGCNTGAELFSGEIHSSVPQMISESEREFSGLCVNESPYTSPENNIRSNGFCHPGYTFHQISTGQRSGIAPTYHRNHTDISYQIIQKGL